jgi:hypothetical protein
MGKRSGSCFASLAPEFATEPMKSLRALWRRFYPTVIQNYESLGKLEKQLARQELRSRVRWRRRARKRRGSGPLEHCGL